MALIQCPQCGAMVSDQATSCPKCGATLSPSTSSGRQPAYQHVAPTQQAYPTTNPQDIPNGGLNVLSLFFPLAGLILWGLYREKTPKKAKACATYAWIGLGISFVIGIISEFIYI